VACLRLREIGGPFWAIGRRAVVPLLLLAALIAYARGGPAAPTLAQGGSAGGLPLPQASLRYVLGEGLPTLGRLQPVPSPLGASGAQAAALGLYGLFGLLPHDPGSLLEDAYAGFGLAPSRRPAGTATRSTLRHWLNGVAAASAAKPSGASGGFVQYGKGPPLVGLYATEGLQAFAGRAPARNAPAPVSAQASRNVLGAVRRLAQDLAAAGVPTVVSLQRNDAEGELGVYLKSAGVARRMLKAEPGLALLLDVERPALPSGPATALVGGQSYATVTLVVGTGRSLPDPNAAENLQLARSIAQYLAASAKGYFLGVARSPNRLNQQISPTMLTLDVGGAAAQPKQAWRSLPGVARGVADFLDGAPSP